MNCLNLMLKDKQPSDHFLASTNDIMSQPCDTGNIFWQQSGCKEFQCEILSKILCIGNESIGNLTRFAKAALQ